MLEKKELSYGVGLAPIPDSNYWIDDDDYINAYLQTFTLFSNKTDDREKLPQDYDAGRDYHGPKVFSPTHCIKTFDFNRPKQMAPYIAIIGTQSNITDQLSAYIAALGKWQHDETPVAKFGNPLFTPVHYNSVEEMDEYIKSPDYKTSRKVKGICYGFQHYVDGAAPNNVTVSFHFPDKKIGLSKLGYEQGVPD